MQTTVLLVELLVIGAEFALLVLFGALWYFDVKLPPELLRMELASLVAIGLGLYPLGIFWSRVSDVFVKLLDSRLKRKRFSSNAVYHEQVLSVLHRGGAAADAMSQVRSQYRLARATGISFILALILYTPRVNTATFEPLSLRGQLAVAGILAFIGFGSLMAWYHLRGHYLVYVLNSSKLIDAAKATESFHSVTAGAPLSQAAVETPKGNER